jgi:hypothetical protein
LLESERVPSLHTAQDRLAQSISLQIMSGMLRRRNALTVPAPVAILTLT